jgi:hypothetical protein
MSISIDECGQPNKKMNQSPRNGKEHPMKTTKLIFGLTALSLIGLGRGSELLAADGGKTNVTVEVLIFSGRPNPTWQLLDPRPLATLKVKLKDLPEAFKDETAGWSRTGFGGFRIRHGAALGLPGEIRIYQGVIKTGQGKSAKYLKDATGLEQSLINESKKQALEPPVREAIARYENARKGAQ